MVSQLVILIAFIVIAESKSITRGNKTEAGNRKYAEDIGLDDNNGLVKGAADDTDDDLEHIDYHAYPKYQYSYGVEDPESGDYKTQIEERDGDAVRGEYTVVEPDGAVRVVRYYSDKDGYKAEVTVNNRTVQFEVKPPQNQTGEDDNLVRYVKEKLLNVEPEEDSSSDVKENKLVVIEPEVTKGSSVYEQDADIELLKTKVIDNGYVQSTTNTTKSS